MKHSMRGRPLALKFDSGWRVPCGNKNFEINSVYETTMSLRNTQNQDVDF